MYVGVDFYAITVNRKLWFHAKSTATTNIYTCNVICKSVGAELVSIASEEENAFLISWMKSIYGKEHNIVLGSSRISARDPYKWPDGSELRYTNWLNGKQPFNTHAFMHS